MILILKAIITYNEFIRLFNNQAISDVAFTRRSLLIFAKYNYFYCEFKIYHHLNAAERINLIK